MPTLRKVPESDVAVEWEGLGLMNFPNHKITLNHMD